MRTGWCKTIFFTFNTQHNTAPSFHSIVLFTAVKPSVRQSQLRSTRSLVFIFPRLIVILPYSSPFPPGERMARLHNCTKGSLSSVEWKICNIHTFLVLHYSPHFIKSLNEDYRLLDKGVLTESVGFRFSAFETDWSCPLDLRNLAFFPVAIVMNYLLYEGMIHHCSPPLCELPIKFVIAAGYLSVTDRLTFFIYLFFVKWIFHCQSQLLVSFNHSHPA